MTFNEFRVHVRSFAPFKTFGGGFEGDNRGHSSDPCKPARMIGSLTFSPLTGAVTNSTAFSYESQWVPAGLKDTAKPDMRIGAIRTGPRGIYVQLDLAGANPLTKGLVPTPAIDVHLQLEAELGAGALNLSAALCGDAFPNAEMFLEDYAGVRRMLGTFTTAGGRQLGPMTLLWGDTRRPMTGICKAIAVDGTGRFV